jgi:hypothetical protein
MKQVVAQQVIGLFPWRAKRGKVGEKRMEMQTTIIIRNDGLDRIRANPKI